MCDKTTTEFYSPQLLNKQVAQADYWKDKIQAETGIGRAVPKPSQELDATPTQVSMILNERGKRYGSFKGHAHVTQSLKIIINDELLKRGKILKKSQQEALDMICHKIGRIVNGDPDYDDSWIDIAGYAQLIVDELHGKLT